MKALSGSLRSVILSAVPAKDQSELAPHVSVSPVESLNASASGIR
jgi:hypothetical protein